MYAHLSDVLGVITEKPKTLGLELATYDFTKFLINVENSDSLFLEDNSELVCTIYDPYKNIPIQYFEVGDSVFIKGMLYWDFVLDYEFKNQTCQACTIFEIQNLTIKGIPNINKIYTIFNNSGEGF